MLTILQELSKHRDEEMGTFNLHASKLLYFSTHLSVFGINVGKLTGDSQMTQAANIRTKARIIVTTPEKWDIIASSPSRALIPVTQTSSNSLSLKKSIFCMMSLACSGELPS
jgi:hypothetical protein